MSLLCCKISVPLQTLNASVESTLTVTIMAAGAEHEPKGDTLPPSYHGPTTKSASGALAASDGLTTGFPKDGISGAIPATSASQKPYDTNRPYKHT